MHADKLPTMAGARESNENALLFSAALGQMRSMRAIVGAQIASLQGRADTFWSEKKTAMQGQLSALLGGRKSGHETKPSSAQAQGTRRKRSGLPGAAVNPSKRARKQLPKLPEDVLVRILGHVSVHDIRNSRLVCRFWRWTIDKHELELWKGCCSALGCYKQGTTF